MTHTREGRRDLVDRILLLRLAEQNGLVPIVRDVVLLAFRRDVEFICLVISHSNLDQLQHLDCKS